MPWSRVSLSMFEVRQCANLIAVFLSMLVIGCGSAPNPVDEPISYASAEQLRARLRDVAKYGDGGSSLGGIPESIAELTKHEPEKGKRLQEAFLRLNTADNKEKRKDIAKEMAEML